MKTKKQIKEGAYSESYKTGYEDARKDFDKLIDELNNDETNPSGGLAYEYSEILKARINK